MSWLSSLLGGVTKAVKSVGPLGALIPGAGPWLTGLGALQGLQANQDAERDARNAMNYGKGLEARTTALWDMMLANVQKAEAAGQYDPERRIRQLETDTANYESKDLGNLGGALRVAGYREGDSEIGTRLDSVKLKYRKFLDTQREKIRTDTFNEKLSAYGSINPGLLQPGLQGSQFRYNAAESRQQDPSNFVSAIMPFLNKGKKQGTTTSAPSASSSKWQLPVQYGFKK